MKNAGSHWWRCIAAAAPVAGVWGMFCGETWAGDASGQRPNILFILTDQWRGAATGFNGDPNVKTPHLDKLAAEAINFRNAISVCPVCTPYRASLMTGRFPTSTGMFLNDVFLPGEELCMAEIFQGNGYDTGYIGKWHLDGHGRDRFIPAERRQGWDYWKVAECCHAYNNSFYYDGDDREKKYWDGYDAYAQTKDAQEYLKEKAKGEKPFILLISYGSPHFPHATAPEEYKKLYPPEKIKLPPNVPEAMEASARKEAQGYYAHCTALDRCVGDLLKTVKETGLAENTIVVFTSDHGEMLGSQGCNPTRKQFPFDESARVPFLLRFPSQPGGPGVVVKTPLNTPDILPTLLGLAKLPVPASIEGEDLSRLVLKPEAQEDRAALYQAVAPFGYAAKNEYRAIRTSRHTYVRYVSGKTLLFDDEKDPHQMENLADNPAFADVRQKLETQLQEEMTKRNDGLRDGQYYLDLFGFEIRNGNTIRYQEKAYGQSPKRRAGVGITVDSGADTREKP